MLRTIELKPGDSILFERGSVFHGTIAITGSGTKGKAIVFSAYGKGSAPVLTGAIKLSAWNEHKKGIFESPVNDKVFELFSDNHRQTLARYPNSGWLSVSKATGTNGFIDTDITNCASYWDGTICRMRQIDWEYRYSSVKSYSNGIFELTDPGAYPIQKGFGYYLDDKYEELDSISEWFCDIQNSKIFYKPMNGNIHQATIEGSTVENLLTIAPGVNYIEIENLKIEKVANYGVWAKGDNNYIVIDNCEFDNIGNTAVHFNICAKFCSVLGSSFENILGRGIFALEPENMSIENNTLKKIGLVPGYGISGVNGMQGINVSNIEEEKTPDSHLAKNNIIRNNWLEDIGFIGIRMDGCNGICEFNYVKNSMIHLNDGAAIYCFATGKNYTHDNIIRNNIIDGVTGSVETAYYNQVAAHGIYVDNNSYNIEVTNNTVANVSGAGIIINWSAFNIKVHSNTVYNSHFSILIAEDKIDDANAYFTIENNLFFSIDRTQRLINITNWQGDGIKSIWKFNNNKYYSLIEQFVACQDLMDKKKEDRKILNYTFSEWKRLFGQDSNTKSYENSHSLSAFANSSIFYNQSHQQKIITLPDRQYYTREGLKTGKSIELPPFSSEILLWE
jgi:hypothetical protein